MENDILNASNCAVILVNYKNTEDTLQCLESLFGLHHLPAHIFVVDNASTAESMGELYDGWAHLCAARGLQTPECISAPSAGVSAHPAIADADAAASAASIPAADSVPRFALLPQQENLGFSGGNNKALSLLLVSSCQAFWLLNNDTTVDPFALDALCAAMNAEQGMGLCGSTVVYAAKPYRLQCAAGGKLCPLTGKTSFIHENMPLAELAAHAKAAPAVALDWILGCSLFIRRSAVQAIGLLPEEYFLYYEDVAYSCLARRRGFQLGWAGESIVYHKEGGSTGAKSRQGATLPVRSLLMDYLSIRNRLYLLRIFYPWSLPVTVASLCGVFCNRLRRGQANRLPTIVRAAWDGLCKNMGFPASKP
ncbi:MAG: glycosyltransferase family 2 protein [Desulfovibrio sp.]|jgi:GT2 family glycosyltransferase|nr:glycosyltransferase family 2 protein [Desulfovibrio sp.]